MPTLNEQVTTQVARLQAAAQIQHDVANGTSSQTVATISGQVRTVANAIATLMATVARGAWLTTTVYAQKDLVTKDNVVYICVVAHTAGTFATDLGAGKWAIFSGPADEGSLASGFGRQHRRGTTAQHAAFTGLAGEFTFDTDKALPVAHDGLTAGGFPLQHELAMNIKVYGAVGDGVTDDSAAINAALAAHDNVFVPPGTFVAANIALQEGNRFFGTKGSVLALKAGETNLIALTNSNTCIERLVLDGGNNGPWAVSTAVLGSRNGIHINNAAGLERITLRDLEIKGFDLGGITGVSTVVGYQFGHRVTMDNINCHHNYVGIGCNPYFEYALMTNCYTYKNHIGIYCIGGNNKFIGCNSEENYINCDLQGGYNNTHGGFYACSFNHAATGVSGALGLRASNVTNGMKFVGCMFWYGDINLNTCTGIDITDGQFGAGGTITVVGGGLNRFNNNYCPIIPTLALSGDAKLQFRGNRTNNSGVTDIFEKYNEQFVEATTTSYADGSNFGSLTEVAVPFTWSVKKVYNQTANLEFSHQIFVFVPGSYQFNASLGFGAHTGAADQTVTLRAKVYALDGSTVIRTYEATTFLKAGQAKATVKLSEQLHLEYGQSVKLFFLNTDAAGFDIDNSQCYFRLVKSS